MGTETQRQANGGSGQVPWLQPTVENRVMDFLSLLPMAMSRVLATLALVSSISRFMSQPWEVGPVSVLVWG